MSDTAEFILMVSICLTSIKAEGVEVPEESYEVINGINGIIRTIYHTAITSSSTLDEATKL